MKRIINFILCIALMLGIMPTMSGFAAAPIAFEGDKTTVFEQSFGGLGGSGDLSDFTVTGSKWQYNDYFMGIKGSTFGDSVATKSDITFEPGSGFEFKATVNSTYNSIAFYLGYNPDTCEGYMVEFDSNDAKYRLFKDTSYDGTPTLEAAAGSHYGSEVEYTIIMNNGTINVSTNTGDSAVFTYDATKEISGKFGVVTLSTADFALHSMSLYKYEAPTVVNTWKYEKNFSAADTVEALAKDGITISNSDVTFEADNMHTASNQVLTYAPYGKDLSGDYTIEAAVRREWNATVVRFNYVDDSNYYQLILYANNATGDNEHAVRLTKVKNGASTPLKEGKYTNVTTGAGGGILTYNISVEEATEGLKINTSITSSYTNEVVTLPEVIDTDYIASGKIQIRNESTGGSRFYSLKAYSTPSNETYTKDVVITNKAVTANDTVATLAAEGITFVDYSNNTVAPKEFGADYVSLPSATVVKYSPKGGNLGESYVFEGKLHRGYNDDYLQFNYLNDSNYYKVMVIHPSKDANGNVVSVNNAELVKVKGGTSTVLDTDVPAGINPDWGGTCGTYTYHDYKVVVNKTDAGLKIDVEVRNGNTDDVVTLSAVDTEPLDAGIARLCAPNTDDCKFYYIKHSESRTMGGTYTKDVVTVDKTFTADQTPQKLAQDNITISKDPTEYGDSYFKYGHNVNPVLTYAPEGGLSDSYTFETKIGRGYQNNPSIKFNVQDDKNYYLLNFYNNNWAESTTPEVNRTVQLQKFVNGKKTAVLDTASYDDKAFSGGYMDHSYVINVEKTDAGVAINASITASNGTGTVKVSAVDGDNAYTGGNVVMEIISGDYANLYYVKNTDHVLCGDTGEYQGHFYIDNYAASSMDAGKITFEFPVAHMGNHTAVAALYDGNEMTAVKTFTAEEMFAGTVDLFDTASDDTANMSIKVFVFDTALTLNRITQVYELK